MLTKEEWERDLLAAIEDAKRKAGVDPAEYVRIALAAKGVDRPHVVWKKATNEGPRLPLSAGGFIRDESGNEHEFVAWLDFDQSTFKWIDPNMRL